MARTSSRPLPVTSAPAKDPKPPKTPPPIEWVCIVPPPTCAIPRRS